MKEKCLAPSTIRQAYTVLRTVLDAAVRDGLGAKNVAAQVKRPSVPRKEAKHFDGDQFRQLLEAAQETLRQGHFLLLLGLTGMRRGEALALRREDVDLEAGTLRVRGTLSRVGGKLVVTEPKTERSRRTIAVSETVVELLAERRRVQAEKRAYAGRGVWGETGFGFTSATGPPCASPPTPRQSGQRSC